jgi:hypothetical protein
MLEPHLARKKYQEESKLQHHEPPAYIKLLLTTLPWETRRAPIPPDTGSKPAWESSGRPTGEHQTSCGIPTATPGINQHCPLDRLTPYFAKKELNNKQGIEKECEAERVGCCKLTGKGRWARSWSSPELSIKNILERQKGQQRVGDKMLPEIGQVAVHKAHFLSQWATSKVKWCCKIEKQSANHHNMLTAGSHLMDLWPCPRERGEAKKQAPNKPTQQNPNSEAGWLVG